MTLSSLGREHGLTFLCFCSQSGARVFFLQEFRRAFPARSPSGLYPPLRDRGLHRELLRCARHERDQGGAPEGVADARAHRIAGSCLGCSAGSAWTC